MGKGKGKAEAADQRKPSLHGGPRRACTEPGAGGEGSSGKDTEAAEGPFGAGGVGPPVDGAREQPPAATAATEADLEAALQELDALVPGPLPGCGWERGAWRRTLRVELVVCYFEADVAGGEPLARRA